ncbi:MAG: permease [Desulfuromonas sp.]|nr:MAG: permease [Desulfuromonas sp.]
MLRVGLVYLALMTLVYLVLWRRDPAKVRQSLLVGGKALAKLLPLLLAVFGLVGLFQVYLPPERVEAWLGASGGLVSLLVGALAGAISIGPPLAAYPLAGSLLDAGAWPPAVAAFIVSWISVGVVTLPFEAQTFSLRFSLLRNGLSFLAAMLIGLLLGGVL